MRNFLISGIIVAILVIGVIVLKMTFQEDKQTDTAENKVNKAETIDDTMENNNSIPEDDTAMIFYTLEEISLHDTSDDCWIILNDKVYDVTSFIPTHPGGNAILEGCGKDATELFTTRPMGTGTPHSDDAQENVENYYIGDLSN